MKRLLLFLILTAWALGNVACIKDLGPALGVRDCRLGGEYPHLYPECRPLGGWGN